MNTRHLALFREVALTGNLTQVAQRLHISQPAVSMQLHRLEEEVGVPLFALLGRQMTLTDAGRAFLEYTEEILSLEEQLTRVMDEFNEGRRGRVVVGTSLGVGTYLLPQVIQEFAQSYPKIVIDLQVCAEEEIEKFVRNGHFDLGFTMRMPMEHFSLRVTKFTTDQFIGIRSPAITPQTKLWIPKDIAGLCPAFHEMRKTADELPNKFAATTNRHTSPLSTGLIERHIEIGCLESMELVKRYVAAGLGYGLVLRSAAAKDLEQGQLSLWTGYVEQAITINMVTRPAEHLARSTWIFLHHVRTRSTHKEKA
ncbi:LysR family transcriptional regulator [Sulfoacidibacillus thermotolerans]|uniref:HTH lysR-type domain-containing protein n=1 Tax=Sulfoacidibacillus thermotolerans TaxID=1765684 RepID=A0A2U3D9T8_SULT2|nr:LysR substrate-binding domain-containing protein [Sulfoacidibacillus thermotolerans]PWI58050.1 hypothetical protein BM613_05100 [Sulfoacidibacillus thermotolerans]